MSLDPASERPISRATQARALVPFAIVTLLWSSTWLVIRDQLGVVPPSWSVTYRFAVAGAAMFAWAAATRRPLRLGAAGQGFALIVGLMQFCCNFNFVYRGEQFVTSGLVALVFALLIVPNTLLAAIFLGQGVSRRFLAGSAVAIVGIGLLFAHELHVAPGNRGALAEGIGFTFLGVLSASVANVMQASERGRALPAAGMLAWAMLWGALIDAAFAWATVGPPVIELRWSYWAGTAYLGVLASAVAFTLYFGVIRAIGPGRAAYSSVLVPIIAMGLSTIFESYRWSLAAAGGGALTLAGLVIALRARSPAR